MPMLSDPVNSSLDARDDAMNLAIYGPLAIGPRATNIAMKRAIKMQLSSEQNETTVLEMLPHLKTWIICATNISYLLPRIYDLPNMFSFVQYFISPSQDLWSSYEIYFQIASCRAFSLSSKHRYSHLCLQHPYTSKGGKGGHFPKDNLCCTFSFAQKLWYDTKCTHIPRGPCLSWIKK